MRAPGAKSRNVILKGPFESSRVSPPAMLDLRDTRRGKRVAPGIALEVRLQSALWALEWRLQLPAALHPVQGAL